MSNRLPDNFIQDLLARTDIVEIIQARLKLTKKGKEYLSICPFHSEKTPSFSVSPAKQFYYCFGCHAHGNAIGFLMQYDRMDFMEAVTYLAHQLGVELPQLEQTSQSIDTSLYDLMHKVALYYQKQLKKFPAALQYLKQRGIDDKTALRFQLGYAPASWDNLARHIKNPKQRQQLLACGLLIQKDNGHCYDRFRDRLMFPIRNPQGKVIAFGGRSLGEDLPKYINSPETELFRKNRELFGLCETRQTKEKITRFILVEGYLDVIALDQQGIGGAVATLGTAVNVQHLQKLLRYAREIIFCFDGDTAGHHAAWKALTLSLPLLRDDMSCKFLFLPEGEDPDSLVRKEGADSFRQRLQKAIPLSQVFFTKLKREYNPNSIDGKARMAKAASEFLNTMPKGIMRQLLYQQLTQILQIELSDLQSIVKEPLSATHKTQINQEDGGKAIQLAQPVKRAIELLLHNPSLAKQTLPTWIIEIDLPGMKLLRHLLETYQRTPILSTGGLLAECDNPVLRALIAEMAAKPLAIPTAGITAEFAGALHRCFEAHRKQKIDQLITKAKNEGLLAHEKSTLRKLLAEKAQKAIES